MKNPYPLRFLILFVFGSLHTQASVFEKHPSVFDYLSQTVAMDITFDANFTTLCENRRTDDYAPGVFRFQSLDKKEITMPLKVKPRGKFRRKICGFPPLKLKFSKKYLRSIGLDTFNNIKLVTPCLDGDPMREDYLLREYLAYKIYNQLTDKSLRVKLLRITFRDVARQIPVFTDYAFIIEDDEELAHRLGGQLCDDCFNAPAAALDTYQTGIAGIFNLLIGNSDWDPVMVRNVEVVKPLNGGGLIFVPYDFDFSGLVNPPYARPPSFLNIESVKERAYRGIALERSDLISIKTLFLAKADAIILECKNFKTLPRSSRREIVKYINTFYEEIDISFRSASKPEQTVENIPTGSFLGLK